MPRLCRHGIAECFADDRFVRNESAVRVELLPRDEPYLKAFFIRANEHDEVVELGDVHVRDNDE